MSRHIFRFGDESAEVAEKSLVGGKGYSLAEMSRLGFPVPAGFTISSGVCRTFLATQTIADGIWREIDAALEDIGKSCRQGFGDEDSPMLVSVRSGAAVSMPGMMDTILNVGLNERTVVGLAKSTGDEKFAYDCYRRLIATYGDVVLGVTKDDENPFEALSNEACRQEACSTVSELSLDATKKLITKYKISILEITGKTFPEDCNEQLRGAIHAVFSSWSNARALSYRALKNIDDNLCTAVNIQRMVFGNRGDKAGTGVAFTRNPSTGKKGMYGEFLQSAQGEDIVSGVHTPKSLTEMQKIVPEAHASLISVATQLEAHFGDMQDIEFTVEDGKLWLLQSRSGKRTGAAMLQIAIDLVDEGRLSKSDAVMSLEVSKIDELMHPRLDPKHGAAPICHGLPASPGAAVGVVALSSSEAVALADRGLTPILVRRDTSPEDIDGMKVAAAIVTERGGMTSHAAVVARGMGIACITAARGMKWAKDSVTFGDETLASEAFITVDGKSGDVYKGKLPLLPAEPSDSFQTVMGWVNEFRRLKVRANADTEADARSARGYGAEGIGLCRTEHMFFAPEKIALIRKVILKLGDRDDTLQKLLEIQSADFAAILKVMDGLPVTIRLLDPPLHEFLPKKEDDIATLAVALGCDISVVRDAVERLAESNPMLGHRGCRLGVTDPDLYRMQVEAILRATTALRDAGLNPQPEIMIPFVSSAGELKLLAELVAAVPGETVPVGTMIELPRACMVADQIAAHADFFSFGTNDLTQTVFGYSRDDSAKFLPAYVEQGLLRADPFVTIDRAGVGSLIELAVEKGRSNKTKLKIGICGEHGGDPSSVEFCHRTALDYVSCSPYRIPIAKLSAAQAALRRDIRK